MEAGAVTLQKKTRIVWIDQLRAVAFFFVVLGHVTIPDTMRNIIYSFHMPLFFMISGMTVNLDKLEQMPIWETIKKQFFRLIVPYIWLNLLMFPQWVLNFRILEYKESVPLPEIFKGIFVANSRLYESPSNALWFIPTLAIANILFALVVKFSKKDLRWMAVVIGVFALAGFSSKMEKMIWHLDAALTAVVFLFIGYLIVRYFKQNDDKIKALSAVKYTGIVLLFLAVGLYAVRTNGYISMASNNFGKYLIWFYIAAVTMSIVVVLIVRLLPKIRWLTYIGCNTLIYLAVHVPVIRTFERLFPEQMKDYRYSIPFAILLYFAIVPLCFIFDHWFPYMIGKMDYKNTKSIVAGKYLMTAFCLAMPLYAIINPYFKFSLHSVLIFLVIWILVSAAAIIIAQRFMPWVYLQPKRKRADA